ncbi:ABC transporter ATP-binding protein, partial [Streptomyces sp. MUM 203J]|nr:ABC transporter ATP-binding protein [Streptomyces sp. MUM 203J]
VQRLAYSCAEAVAARLRPGVTEVLAGWPAWLPLPPAAFGAGLLGAFSYGHEFRYPVLQHALGAAPRRLGLLLAKLAVTAGAALLLAVAVGVVNLEVLHLFYGGALIPVPENWPEVCAAWAGLLVGSGWAGLLAAGLFRATAAGPAAVLAVPVVIAPLVERAVAGPSPRSIAGFPARLWELASADWPREAGHWLDGALRPMAQPMGIALTLSLFALLCSFLLQGLRRSIRR